jgi:hypothetical protein
MYFQPILTPKEWESGELSSFMVYREFKNAKADYPKHTIAAYGDGDIENPTFVDDEDDRTITYFVDIPQTNGNGKPSEEWLNVESFKTRLDAIDFAKKHFGADENGMVSLISQS